VNRAARTSVGQIINELVREKTAASRQAGCPLYNAS
jgi:hypothetical protein